MSGPSVSAFESAVVVFPNAPWAWRGYADAYAVRQTVDEVLRALTELISLGESPENEFSRVRKRLSGGACCLLYKAAIEKYPDQPWAWRAYADAAADCEDVNDVLRALTALISLGESPENEFSRVLKRLSGGGRCLLYKDAVEKYPDQPWAWRANADAAADCEDVIDVLRALTELISLGESPENEFSRVRNQLSDAGRCLLYKDAVEKYPNQPWAWRAYTVAFANCWDVDAVRQALPNIAKLEGTNEETTVFNVLTAVNGGSQRGLFYENVKTAFPRILNGTNQVLLSTSDGRLSVTDEEVAKRSVIIRTALEDVPSRDDVEDYIREPIPLHNVSARVLDKVLEYCERYRGEPLPTTNDDSSQHETLKRSTDITEWDKKFITVDQDMLFDIILAANYLDIKPLLDLGCRTVANMLKGMTPEELRKLFNIVNEYTPEEEAQIKKEKEWEEDR